MMTEMGIFRQRRGAFQHATFAQGSFMRFARGIGVSVREVERSYNRHRPSSLGLH